VNVNSLTTDPRTSTTLYAATDSGLFKTLDGGKHWAQTVLTSRVTILVIDPIDTNILYADYRGVSKSIDGGITWTQANTSLPQGTISALVIDPQNPATLYVVNSSVVFKTTNGAATWSPSNTGLSPQGNYAPLAIDPRTPTTLYTGWSGAVFQSIDGGGRWIFIGGPGAPVNGVPFGDVHSLTVDPQTPSTLYAGSNGGGLSKSTDSGKTWATLTGLPTTDVYRVALDPQTSTTLYVTLGNGVSKSVDGGGSWASVNTGLVPLQPVVLGTDPHDSATLFAGSASINRTLNGGGSWTPLTSFMSLVSALVIDPQASTIMYASAGNLYRSADGGMTWAPGIGGPSGARTIVIDPTDSTIVYAANGVLYKSTNSGASWGPLSIAASTFALDPQHPSTLYAAVPPVFRPQSPGGIYKSTDAGLTWTKLLDVVPTAIVVDPVTTTTIYAAGTGILKSTDAGLHWSAESDSLDGTSIAALAIDSQAPNVLYAATQQGVFRTSDGANVWSPMNAGLPIGTVINSLALAPSGSCVYLGAGEGLVYAFAVRPDPCNPNPLAAAILPSSRSPMVGQTATAFATIINAGSATASQVGLALATPLAATFLYQTTNPMTNQVTGTPNTPVDIPAGRSQTYVIALTPTSGFGLTNVGLAFGGANTVPPDTLIGIDTLLLSASTTPVPDIVALAATLNNDGIVTVGNPTMAAAAAQTGVFAVATANVGVGAMITASADTEGVSLPLSVSICQTIPATGACQGTAGPSVTTPIDANATPTFGIFVSASGAIPFDPANNRVFVRFKDPGGVTRGATSVAVRTQ
jgi:photosystem II stability/assembly factor-like uncharacterized protein